MEAAPSVGIHYDLAACKAGVTVGPSDHELARGVHIYLGVLVVECPDRFGILLQNAGNQHLADILGDGVQNGPVGLVASLGGVPGRLQELVMLCGDHYGVYMHRLAVGTIFYGHLALGVGTQITDLLTLAVVGHLLSGTADLCEFLYQFMRHIECQRQVFRSLVHGVPEHHALVAGALQFGLVAVVAFVQALGLLGVDATVYIFALAVDGAEYSTTVAVEAVCAAGIAYAADYVAYHYRYVDIGVGINLARHHNLAGGYKCFQSHMAVRVAGQELIEQRVADLVGNFVRVSLRNGFGGKQVVPVLKHGGFLCFLGIHLSSRLHFQQATGTRVLTRRLPDKKTGGR